MSHQHGRRRTGLHGNIQRTNPIVTDRTVPISQIHALPIGDGAAPRAFANVAARNCQDRAKLTPAYLRTSHPPAFRPLTAIVA